MFRHSAAGAGFFEIDLIQRNERLGALFCFCFLSALLQGSALHSTFLEGLEKLPFDQVAMAIPPVAPFRFRRECCNYRSHSLYF